MYGIYIALLAKWDKGTMLKSLQSYNALKFENKSLNNERPRQFINVGKSMHNSLKMSLSAVFWMNALNNCFSDM